MGGADRASPSKMMGRASPSKRVSFDADLDDGGPAHLSHHHHHHHRHHQPITKKPSLPKSSLNRVSPAPGAVTEGFLGMARGGAGAGGGVGDGDERPPQTMRMTRGGGGGGGGSFNKAGEVYTIQTTPQVASTQLFRLTPPL